MLKTKETVTQTSPMVQHKVDIATGTDPIEIVSDNEEAIRPRSDASGPGGDGGGEDAGGHGDTGEGDELQDPDFGNPYSMIKGMGGYNMDRGDDNDKDGSPSSFVWGGKSAGKSREASGAGGGGAGGGRAGGASGPKSGYKQVVSPKPAKSGSGSGNAGGRPAADDGDRAAPKGQKRTKKAEGEKRESMTDRERMQPYLEMAVLQQRARAGDEEAKTLLRAPSGGELEEMVMHHNVHVKSITCA